MYDFSVSSLNSILQESSKITITDITLLWPNPPTIDSYTWSPTNVTIITLNLSAPNPNCSPPITYNLYYSTDNITFNTITGITPSLSYNFNPTSYSTYYFKMTSVNGSGESTFSPTLTANITLFTFSGGSFVTSSQTTGSTTIYNTVIQAGTTTLNFNVLPDSSYCNFLLVGAGGGGGGCWDNPVYPYFDIYSGAGGGGGGNLLVNNFSVSQSTYTILVGTGGAGGEFNTSSAGVATPGQPGGNTSITGPGITNCIAYGGDGGDEGQDGNRADGGTGGAVSFALSSGTALYTPTSTASNGGNGGQGNAGGPGTYTSGQGGTDGYFYLNPSIPGFSYPPSFGYPTYYSPSTTFGFPPVTYYLYTPSSVTLTEWYQVSGGGGGANSNTSTTLAAWQGAGGTGLGGLSGFYYENQVPSISNPSQTPYSSFGGGGGGGGIITFGMNGGNGIAVIWFNYTFP